MVSFKINKPPTASTSRSAPPVRGKATIGFGSVSDDDSDEEVVHQQELVTEIGSKGFGLANGKSSQNEPLVISVPPNKDWRQSARVKRNLYRPDSEKPKRSSTQDQARADEIKPKAEGGLTLAEDTGTSSTSLPKPETPGPEVKEEDNDEGDAVLPLTETEIFKRDIAERAEESTLDDYERVPIEQFGAAFLRGMGWDPEQTDTKVEAYEPAKRPALLGIGAKPLEEALGIEDSGSGKRKAMKFSLGAPKASTPANGASEKGRNDSRYSRPISPPPSRNSSSHKSRRDPDSDREHRQRDRDDRHSRDRPSERRDHDNRRLNERRGDHRDERLERHDRKSRRERSYSPSRRRHEGESSRSRRD